MKKDLIKFILFIISSILFITGIIVNNEVMVYYGYFFTIVTLLFLDNNRVNNYKSIPFILTMFIFFMGCVFRNNRIVLAAGSAIIFLDLRLRGKKDEISGS